MNRETYSFDKLPFSDLFKTYTSDFSKLDRFYSFNPFDSDNIKRRADSVPHTETHQGFISALESFHTKLGITQSDQLQKLGKDGALAVVTGQQLGVYGGPLFTIYKTISAILLASEWEKKLSVPVVPVFWLADEDHDFDEVAWFGIPGNDEFFKKIYSDQSDGKPVSEVDLESDISVLKDSIREEMFDTDFSTNLWKLFDGFYAEGSDFRKAFAQMMDHLFGKHGLLIVGSNFKAVKDLVTETLSQSITDSEGILNSLKEQTEEIETLFHSQVVLGESNLFYLDEGKRVKIDVDGDSWFAGNAKWSKQELVNNIETSSEDFSPNVFLRPVIQDKLLPTLGYVAGPGEVAYYAQMRKMYPIFGLEMPVIFPRFSATLVESGIDRILDKIPFEFHRYGDRIEDLESEYAKISESTDIEALFKKWKNDLEEASSQPKNIISEIDGSLEGTIGKTVSGFTNELDKMKGRVYRSIKQQEQTQLQRIRKIKAQLYPENGLQERMVSFMYFMNKYGTGIWDELLSSLEEGNLELDRHHIIKL